MKRAMTISNDDDDDRIIVQSQCHCQQIALDISLPKDPNDDQTNSNAKVWNCHCTTCRKYHLAAYTSYLQVPKSQISIRRGVDKIGTCSSSCQATMALDAEDKVERWYCTDCSSKLMSIASENDNEEDDGHDDCLVNLGPIDEDTIPPCYSKRWKEQLKQKENNLCSENSCRWTDVIPNYKTSQESTGATKWTGGCACGASRYEIAVTRPAQLQHCYCHLCRELSGGPFMTWIPVHKCDFAWKKQSSSVTDDAIVRLVRTTPFGSRHICSRCRGVLTIVYDSQPGLVWPCAGGID
eukprot:CAMPEP_0202024544 /NCGR_PEP_ID=MMETSP0905-20130828/54352_1 /ASSEMBLY_ACC=CAM_ASM_000554 /TAXON_ID=420261 /ORGANISM="Thalassiosira antarctica, Strain CCMP982" /LENGTH=294 /DNA_ID=CAMNT_0048587207 /DNA_START=268 /DNA_END=1149 /DNA_ORIENTATION=+